MAVITSTFNTSANDVWASSTWAAADPSFKLNTQLTNWVTAINDANKISIIHTPGDATARGNNDNVRWLLRARESDTGSDYGYNFCERSAHHTPSGRNGYYFARTPSTENNGSGTYTTITDNHPFSLSVSREYFTAYEAVGDRPWFVFSTKSTPTTAATYIIARLSITSAIPGSYYPTTGLGRWVMFSTSDTTGTVTYYTPQSRNSSPYIGINNGGTVFNHPSPRSTYGDNYFFGLPALYGDNHYLGNTSSDIIISNSNTGVWGDTVTISGATYRCLRSIGSSAAICFWVKVS